MEPGVPHPDQQGTRSLVLGEVGQAHFSDEVSLG